MNKIDSYLNNVDWRIKENANSGNATFSGLMSYLATTEIANYALENIYPMDIATAHKHGDLHIHDLGYAFVPYCCGWSLGKLIKEGLNRIPGKTSSAPARHLNSLMIQMVNYLGCTQMEAAGAQSFNNVDTHMSPFVKVDNLSFEEVKQYMQQLVFNLNIPSRWGCLTEDAEILTVNGFKPYHLVKLGEHIATYNIRKQAIEYCPIKKMNIYHFRGNLIRFRSDLLDILTTPNHRNVVRYIGKFDEDIVYSEQLFGSPVSFSIPYFDSENDIDVKNGFKFSKIAEKTLFKYNGKVWCPTVENETFVARREGKIFITGNSQAPFTNFSFDLTCPEDMKDKKAIVAGVEQDFTYGDCQAEMDLVNRAFIEIMEEGDSDGQVFTFPIPTYNIDKNFNWDNPIVDNLMAATAKYGIPYFANYVNSDMQASDARSMCPMAANTLIMVQMTTEEEILTILANVKTMYDLSKKGKATFKVRTPFGWRNAIPEEYDITAVYKIIFENGSSVEFGENHIQPVLNDDTKELMDLPVTELKTGYKVPFLYNGVVVYKEIFSIKEVYYEYEKLYCVAVEGESKYFELGNNLLTHNCRLRLDLREIRKRHGGYFGAGDLVGCYDKETELLTDRGWIYFKDLTIDDIVYTLTDDNKIELHKPKQLFEYDYDGELIEFKNNSFDLLVTPNHRMLIQTKTKYKKRKFIRADEYSCNSHLIPKKSIWSGIYQEYFELPSISHSWVSGNHNSNQSYQKDILKIPMNTWLKFFGLFISEGSYDNDNIAQSHGYRVIISQKTYMNEVEEVLNELGFNYRKDGYTYSITNKQLWSYVKQFGHCYDKFIPYELKQLSKEQLQILFDYLMLGDGHTRKNAYTKDHPAKTYYTTSKKLANDVQEIIIKLGYATLYRTRNRGEININGRTHKTRLSYEISFNYSKCFYIKPDKINKVPYKDKVYCCEVENNSVLVRRNGKVTWCGNSIGVCTINLPRIGYLSSNKEQLYKHLDSIMDLAKESLDIKRTHCQKSLDSGLLPYMNRYLDSGLNNHFSTLGIVGMNELLLNFIGKDIGTKEGKELAIEILDHMNDRLSKYQEESKERIMYNLEATPAESTSYRFAKLDVELYSNIITASNTNTPYYTNSVHLPVNYTDDIFKVLDLGDELQTKFSSGTVIHLYIDSAIPNSDITKNLVRKIVTNYKLPYFSITPTFSTCPDHKYIKGEVYKCPICQKDTLVWSRVVGYLRPIQNFNKGKQQEWKDRICYKIDQENDQESD